MKAGKARRRRAKGGRESARSTTPPRAPGEAPDSRPGFRARCQQTECVLPEYFDTSENREIFLALKQGCSDVASLKDKLDEVVSDYVDGIAKISIPEGRIEEKYNDCVLRLRKRYLQNIEMKKADVLRSESESGGSSAELAKQEEQGMENTSKLLEVTHKISRG